MIIREHILKTKAIYSDDQKYRLFINKVSNDYGQAEVDTVKRELRSFKDRIKCFQDKKGNGLFNIIR